MAWTDDTYPQFQQWNQDAQNVQIIQQPASQQPTIILQQLPAAVSSPTPSIRPGHVKQDLVELMMIQNAQMHQVIMNNMTMSALSSFGHSQPQLHPPSTSEEEEEDPEVYHYHYQPTPAYLPYPSWLLPPQPHPSLVYRNTPEPLELAPSPHRDTTRRAVPPPPPPSATRTVGADVPPATDYYDAAERRQ
ncbi:proline-rich protein 29-like [Salvelinus fontinalis]|uniref:proline-rich protein 29-like n=1 Tax=Salvelinus fontinalis TaxID=8038 RepID=UPI0024852749|nr:proline-rich protein 29-like [Salvelinus fontinalis]